MRFVSSLAAAVAAATAGILFLFATQPAAAAWITIDTFTSVTTPNPISGSLSTTGGSGLSSVNLVLTSSNSYATAGSPSGTLFARRFYQLAAAQRTGTDRSTATLSGTFQTTPGDGGSLTVTMDKTALTSGTAFDNLRLISYISYLNDGGATSDITSNGGSGPNNDTLVINKSAGSLTGSLGSGGFARIQIQTIGGVLHYPVSANDWFSSNQIVVPYSAFTVFSGTPNLTLTQSININTRYEQLAADSAAQRAAAFNGSVTITDIMLVPEPSQMALVAGAGVVLGAWRMRKLRQGKQSTEDVIAC